MREKERERVAGIAHWLCFGLAVLLDATSWVRSSSGENFSGRGDFFRLELTWVLTPFPKTLSDESVKRGLVCAHMHSITQTQKILTFMP